MADRRWRIHPIAKKELQGLPRYGKQGLMELMARYRRNEDVLPREVGNYGEGLYALKYSEARNEFRVYFTHVGAHGQVLLMLACANKKSEKADLGSARSRKKTWEAEARKGAKGIRNR